MRNNVAIIIPAFNEESSILNIIEKSLLYGDPIVVDDGSTDQTKKIVINKGVEILTHNLNLGYDEALSTGLKYAFKNGYEFAITIDADGQHNPEIIKIFSENLKKGDDLVLGYRDEMQRVAENLFSFISKIIWKVKDPLCGMKGYRLSLIKDHGPINTFDSYGTEFAMRLVKKDIKFSEVHVITNKRLDDSRIGGTFFTNIKIIQILLTLLFGLGTNSGNICGKS